MGKGGEVGFLGRQAFIMVIPFLTARRRAKMLERPFTPARERVLEENVALYRRLPEAARAKLRDFTRVFVAEKNWEGCGELKGRVTDDMKLVIGAQAALLLLGLGLDPLRDELYPNLQTVLVYPAGFHSTQARQTTQLPGGGGIGIVSEGFANLGEAWHQGPVILSWADAQRGGVDGSDGHNVVIHEFAHKLDMRDGDANGCPPLPEAMDGRTWKRAMSQAFDDFSARVDRDEDTAIDPYAAESPGEFFAVLSEVFFASPATLADEYPEVYRQFATFYRQDPAARAAAQ